MFARPRPPSPRWALRALERNDKKQPISLDPNNVCVCGRGMERERDERRDEDEKGKAKKRSLWSVCVEVRARGSAAGSPFPARTRKNVKQDTNQRVSKKKTMEGEVFPNSILE